jgi:hypothetical protein
MKWSKRKAENSEVRERLLVGLFADSKEATVRFITHLHMRFHLPNGPFRYAGPAILGLILCIFSLFSTSTVSAAPAINRSINYQARLLTSAGSNVSDGTYQVEFSIYSQSAGGTPIWTASGTNSVPTPINVTVTNGLFSVLLGDTTFQGQNAFDFDWYNDSLYVGVTIGADSEMTPRKRLSSVPYAFVSESVQGQFASSTVTSTGGTLFALNQNTADAASATRTVLSITTQGTSNLNDYLIRGSNNTQDVFTISRQGNVTTTGNLKALGNGMFGGLSVSGSSQVGEFGGYLAAAEIGVESDSVWNLVLSNQQATTTWGVGANDEGGFYIWDTALTGSVPALEIEPSINNILLGSSSTQYIVPSYTDIDLGTLSLPWNNIYATGTVYATTDVVVNGQSVCLESGTNCPASSGGDSNWTFNGANGGFIRPATSTNDVVLGATASATAPFYFDAQTVTSSLQIGRNGNANLLVGTSTYGGGLNAAFTVNGDDIFAQGMIGSIEGIYSATGVQVGTGTTVYGDGNLYKTNNGDFRMALNVASSSWRFYTAGAERLTVASSGNIGIGVSNPSEALDVVGSIENILSNASTTLLQSTLSLGAGTPGDIVVRGNYAYVTYRTGTTSAFRIIDVSDTKNPKLISSMTLEPSQDIEIVGNYAFLMVRNENSIAAIDISNPAAPVLAGSSTLSHVPGSMGVYGKYLYVESRGRVATFDITNPLQMTRVATTTISSDNPYISDFAFQGRFAYAADPNNSFIHVLDLTNPASSTVATSVQVDVDSHSEMKLAIQGRYLYVGKNGFTDYHIAIYDISNPRAPVRVATTPDRPLSLFEDLKVSGRYLFAAEESEFGLLVFDVASSTDPTFLGALPGTESYLAETFDVVGKNVYVPFSGGFGIFELPGIETASLLAHSAEFGSFSVMTNGSIANQLAVGGSVLIGPGGLISQGAFAISSTNTTSTVHFAVSTTRMEVSSRLTVGGVNVCLSNGTNCPASSGGDTNWTFSTAGGGFIYPATSTNDVVLGATASTTAPFYFDAQTVTSSLQIGRAGNANLLVGTTTYGGGLNSAFTVNGNDLFTQGMIGSIEGIYSATGVQVGTGTTVYGDGNLYKTNAGDFRLALNNANSSFRFFTSSTERLTVASSGNVGIGTANPSEALDVVGNVENVITGTQDFEFLTSVNIGADPYYAVAQGNYVYTIQGTEDTLKVVDVTDPRAPELMSTFTSLDSPLTENEFAVSGRYAYIFGNNINGNYLSIIDVSNPSELQFVASTTLSINAVSNIAVAGKYAYLAGTDGGTSTGSRLLVVDISNPSAPFEVQNVVLSAVQDGPDDVEVQGRYAYVSFSDPNGTGDGYVYVLDLLDPASPRVVSTTTIPNIDSYFPITVQGRYLYGGSYNTLEMYVIDVSDPTSLSIVATTTAFGTPGADSAFENIYIHGRYVYSPATLSTGSAAVVVYDVASSTNPIFLGVVTTTSDYAYGLAISGRYLFTTMPNGGLLGAVRIPGIETSSILAHSAEFGSFSVMTHGTIANQLTVGGSLSVGAGGIYSAGALGISSTNTTSTITYAVSTTQMEVSRRLTVGGVAVCLANGTNCPASGGSSGLTILTESATDNTIYPVTTTRDVLLGGSTTATAGFIFDSQTTPGTSTLFIGQSTATNFIVQNGLVGFGTSTPRERLTVVGNIANTLVAGQSFTVVTSTFLGTSFAPFSVAVSGEYAYVANANANSVSIVNVSDPQNPVVVTTTITGSTAADPQAIAASGRYVYTVNVNETITAIDVANPSRPTSTATLFSTAILDNPTDIEISGRYAFISNQNEPWMTVMDLLDPMRPVFVTNTFLGTVADSPQGISVQGAYAYIADGSNQVSVVDITDPTHPVFVTNTFTGVSTAPYGIVASGRYLYTGNQGSARGVTILDISNPVSPVFVTTTSAGTGTSPMGVAVSGRYVYTTNVSSQSMSIIDVASATRPILIATIPLATASFPNAIAVQGRYAYVADGQSKLAIVDIGGTEVNGLLAHSAEFGSLSVQDNAKFFNQVSVGGGLNVGNGGIFSMGALAVGSTNTTSTILFAVSSTRGEFSQRLTVGGVNVCLSNGTNCPAASGGDSNWTFSAANGGFIRVATSTQDVIIGSTASSTSPFYFDVETATSTFYLGRNTIANFLLGTSGTMGIGTSTAGTEKLTLVGSMANTLVQGQTFADVASTTLPNMVDPAGTIIDGRYAYVAQQGSGTPLRFHVIDTTFPSAPSSVGSVLLADSSSAVNLFSMARYGRYVYVPGATSGTIYAVDVSDPSAPSSTAGITFSGVNSVVASGKYLFAGNATDLRIYDLSNPQNPSLVRTMTSAFGGGGGGAMHVSGNLLFLGDVNNGQFRLYDITNPTNPELLSTTSGLGGGVVAGKIQGSKLYLGASSFGIYDISNPRSPILNSTVAAATVTNAIDIQGRYAFITQGTGYRVVDVASSTNPIILFTAATYGSQARDLVVSGRYLYHTHAATDGFVISLIPGIETTGLIAHSAEVGSLSVRTDADILNKLFVGGQINVGAGGITSDGALAIHSTNTTSTFAFAVSSTRLTVSDTLNIGGTSIFAGNMAVGTSTVSALDKLSVVGNIRNVLVPNQTFTDTASTTLPNLTDPAGLIVEGKYGYLAQQGSGTSLRFHVIDVSEQTSPSSVGSVLLSDGSSAVDTFSMARFGKYFYVPGNTSGTIYVVDVSDPSAPSSTAGITFSGVRNVVVSGKYLFAGSATDLRIYDLSNPTNPSLVRTLGSAFPGGSGGSTHVSGNLLFLGDVGGGNFRLYDITDPTNPELLSTTSGPGGGVVAGRIQGRYLYIGASFLGVYDISNPRSPALKDTASGATVSNGLWVNGRYAYIASTNGYTVYDVASSTDIVTIRAVTGFGGQARDLVQSGRYLYHTHQGSDSLVITDVSGIETNGLIAANADIGDLTVRSDAYIFDRLTVGGSFWVGAGGISSDGSLMVHSTNTTSTFMYAVSTTRLRVDGDVNVGGNGNFGGSMTFAGDLGVGTSTPSEKLTLVGNLANTLVQGQSFTDVASTTLPNMVDPAGTIIDGRYAYVAQQGSGTPLRFHVIDTTFPSAPSSVGSVLLADSSSALNTFSMARYGRYVYVPGQTSGTIYVVDVSDPSAPSSTAGITFSSVHSVVAIGKYLFAGSIADVRIYDLSNPQSPSLVRTMTSAFGGGGGGAMHVSGNLLFLGDVNNGQFRLYDITNPTNPELLSTTSGLGGGVVAGKIQGSKLYLGASGFGIYDISNPRLPVLNATVAGASVLNAIDIQGRYAFVTQGTGYRVIDVASSTSPITLFTTSTYGSQARDLVVSGRYLYHTHAATDGFVISLIPGIETTGLIAHSAEVGSLSVRTDADILNKLFVGGQINVGAGGITSDGALAIHSTNTTSTFAFAVSSTRLTVSDTLSIGGTSIFAGNVAMGTSTISSLDKLSVVGNIRNVLVPNQTFTDTASTTLPNLTDPAGLIVEGKYAYVGQKSQTGASVPLRFHVIDISNPESVSSVGSILLSDNAGSTAAFSMARFGKYMYVPGQASSTIYVVDVSDPSSPTSVASLTLSNVMGLAISSHYLFAGDLTSLRIYDVSNPTAPQLIRTVAGVWPGGGGGSLYVSGNYLVSGDYNTGPIRLYDITDPTNPEFLSTQTPGGAPRSLQIQGRYLYFGTNVFFGAYDIANPRSPVLTDSMSISGGFALDVIGRTAYVGDTNGYRIVDVASSTNIFTIQTIQTHGSDARELLATGRSLIQLYQTTDSFVMTDIAGIETNGLVAATAEFGSVQVQTDGYVGNRLSVGGGLLVGVGGISSQGAFAVHSTNTTSTFAYAVSSSVMEVSNRLTVGGVSVCLANGTNCQVAGGGGSSWTFDATSGFIRPVTSTNDIVLGATASATAPFYFDAQTVTSSLQIGRVGNANLLVGTTTYGGGLNSAFTLNGNDLFTQGMIGSIEGIYSATGVQVGTGTTVYGDGNLYKTNAGDFRLALNDISSSFRFFTSSTERLTIASNGNIGVGTSTPSDALTVAGNIENTFLDPEDFKLAGSALIGGGTSSYNIDVSGQYVYIPEIVNEELVIIDAGDPANPRTIGRLDIGGEGAEPIQVVANGSYVYMTRRSPNAILTIDVSNPKSPRTVATTTLSDDSDPFALTIVGRYLYTKSDTGMVFALDLLNPALPREVASTTAGGTGGGGGTMVHRDGFLYATDVINGQLDVVDIRRPESIAQVASQQISTSIEGAIAQYGRYVYVILPGNEQLAVIDVSNPFDPVQVATTTVYDGLPFSSIHGAAGRYLYCSGWKWLMSCSLMLPLLQRILYLLETFLPQPGIRYLSGNISTWRITIPVIWGS